MAENLTVAAVFKLIDEMSGPLQKIGLAIDGTEKATRAASRTLRGFAAAGAAAFAAHEGAEKLHQLIEAGVAATEPLAEAKTKFEQIAGAQKLAAASSDAMNLSMQYGQASWQEELDAITRAYQLYGNYAQAVGAARAATQLATATHADVGATLEMLATTARNAGVSVDVLSDKFATLYKTAGPASAENQRQLERAMALAQSQGVTLDRFLAIAAEAQKTLGSGAGRDLFTYFEEAGKGGRLSERSLAVHHLIDTRGADIDALEKRFATSGGASASSATTAMADPSQQLKIAAAAHNAAMQAMGQAELKNAGELAKLQGAFDRWLASVALAHPNFTQAGADILYLGEGVLNLSSKLGTASIAIRALMDGLEAMRGATTVTAATQTAAQATEATSAAAASAALGTEAVAESGVAAGAAAASSGLGTEAVAESGVAAGAAAASSGLGTEAVAEAGAAASAAATAASVSALSPGLLAVGVAAAGVWAGNEIYQHLIKGSKAEDWLASHLHDEKSTVGLKDWHPHGGSSAVTVHVEPSNVTINVTVPETTGPADAHATAAAMKAALDTHDTELKKKIAEAVDDHKTTSARTDFDDYH